MKDFLLLFHSEPNPNMEPSPEDIQAELKQWQDWMGGIAAQGKLKNAGEALDFEGRVVHSDGSTTDGPYAAVKEIVGGYTIVSAENLDEATKLSAGCPVLAHGGKVEIRGVMNFEGM